MRRFVRGTVFMNPPILHRVRQNFPATPPIQIRAGLALEFSRLRSSLRPGARIAVAVGSRGICEIGTVVAAVLEQLRAAGAQPFILPAMGSHGGATPEGQCAVLAEYDITEAKLGVPIRPSLEVRSLGRSADGVEVPCSVEALSADGILLVNRVKPHTDFSGDLGSGLLKMAVIGLGKHAGAIAMHQAASRRGHAQVLRNMARVVLKEAPVIGGIAILENPHHQIARLAAVPAAEMEAAEATLLAEARALMPRLPFDEIDLLIVDRLGKNISGAGMDPNVIGRGVQGYSASLQREGRPAPFIRRIFVRDLTPETHGNAIGVGLADVTTTRLVRAIDSRATAINALTALSHQAAKIPIHFETDREAIERTLGSLALDDPASARIVRIADTLSLVDFEVSAPLVDEVRRLPALELRGPPFEMPFGSDGNLA